MFLDLAFHFASVPSFQVCRRAKHSSKHERKSAPIFYAWPLIGFWFHSSLSLFSHMSVCVGFPVISRPAVTGIFSAHLPSPSLLVANNSLILFSCTKKKDRQKPSMSYALPSLRVTGLWRLFPHLDADCVSFNCNNRRQRNDCRYRRDSQSGVQVIPCVRRACFFPASLFFAPILFLC